MDIVSQILLMVAAFIFGLFIRNYFPKYIEEKGKNLATKEDIGEITDKI